MASYNWDSTDLINIDYQGWINEDVMQQIFDISRIPLPATDLFGSGSHGNEYFSWLTDELNPPVQGGWKVDGVDSDEDLSEGGRRIGNHSGILTKEVRVSTRAQASDTIGMAPLSCTWYGAL